MASNESYDDVILHIKYAIADINNAIDIIGKKLGSITIGDSTSKTEIESLQQARRILVNSHKEFVYAREIAYPRD